MKPGTNKLLDFLHGLYRFQTTEMLSRFICQQLPLLLPCENVGLVEHDGKHRILTSLVAQHPLSATPLMPHINESGVASTHPFWQTIFDPARPVQHITDVTSKTDWLNNAFYCEVFKQDGLEGHIKMEVFGNRDRFTSINILRSNQTFSREDIELLKGLYLSANASCSCLGLTILLLSAPSLHPVSGISTLLWADPTASRASSRR